MALLLLLGSAGAYYVLVWARPELTPSAPHLDLGQAKASADSVVASVALANTGHSEMLVGGLEITGDGAAAFSVSEEDCVGVGLDPRQSCSVNVRFAPVAAGPRSARLRVSSNATHEPLDIELSGVGTAPVFELLPGVVDFGRQAVGGVSEPVEVQVANRGSAAGKIARLSIEGAEARRFRWLSNRCSGQEVTAAASCRASLAFEPARSGPVAARLRVETESGELSLELLGVGMAPGLLLEPASLAFGDQRAGRESAPRDVTLENTGNAPLDLAAVELTGGGRQVFEVEAGSCLAGALAPGGRCRLVVLFAPTGEGESSARLRISARGLSEPAELPLSGRGTRPRLTLSSDRLELGRVVFGDSSSASITVESSGSETVRLSGVDVSGSREMRLEGDCRGGERLAPGQSCTARVSFTPLAEGAQSAVLTVRAVDVETFTVDVTGSGYPPPVARLSVSPAALDFERLRVGGRSEIASLRVASSGTAQVRFSDLRVEGAHAAEFQMVPASCNGIPFLVPGSECVVGFRFVPRGEGLRQARLVIEHDGVGGRTVVPLSGAADPP